MAKLEVDQPAGEAEFLAELGHELRTPLAAMIGFAEGMREEVFGALPETYRRHATLIAAAGRHLESLAADLLAFQPRPPEPFDLAALVSDTLALLAERARGAEVSLALGSPPSPLMVRAAPGQVRQILLNLLANALAATPPRGSIAVAVSADRTNLRLTVSDTGPGLPAEGTGMGLGLAIVRRLCVAHGGALDLRLGESGGVVASVTLRQASP